MKARDLRVISGGQTGADQGGLEGARLANIETGGWAPKGYKTESGPNYALRDTYGLLEHPSDDYADRTWANVQMADITLWFGNSGSRGYLCTWKACRNMGKDLLENYTERMLGIYLREHTNVAVVNVAGNRASHNSLVFAITRDTIRRTLTDLVLIGVLKTKDGG